MTTETPPTVVEMRMTGRTQARPHAPLTVPLTVQALYKSSDPYAVHFTFVECNPADVAVDGGEPAVWVVSRETLWGACVQRGRSGMADVIAEYVESGSEVAVYLSTPDSFGEPHELRLPHARLLEFLCKTNSVVPVGGESSYSQIDQLIMMCLEGIY